jgi:hypothetical protein
MDSRRIARRGRAAVAGAIAAMMLIGLGGCLVQAPGEATMRYADAGTRTDAEKEKDAGSASDEMLDPRTMFASISNGKYRASKAFRAVSAKPYLSTAGAASSWINVWVSADAYAAYAAIAPEKKASRVELPPGALIVREVVAADGTVQKLTLMLKGPSGFNPELGDWWFAVTDPTGAPGADDGGLELGRMDACYSCHLPRKDDDFLFGVPKTNRAPHP